MALKFTKLTRLNIRSLKYPGKIIENGISVERLKNGDSRYKINISVNGTRVHRLVGYESDGTTRSQAETAIENIRGDIRSERFDLSPSRKTVLGFEEASKKYIVRLKLENGNDIKMKIMRLEHNLVPFFKNKPIDTFKSFDFERYKKSRLEGKISSKGPAKKSTINRDLAVVSHLFNMFVEWELLEHLPCKIKKFREPEGRIVFLSKEEIEALFEAAKVSPNPVLYPFCFIAINSSMRRMEILSIRIEYINFSNNTIFVHEAKGGSRNQKITSKLADYLQEYIKMFDIKEGWLFPAPKSKTGHTVAIERPFREAVKLAGLDVKAVVRHTLRHSAISHMVQANINIPMVKRLAGHKNLETTMKYIHQNAPDVDKAMQQFEDQIESPKTKKLKAV